MNPGQGLFENPGVLAKVIAEASEDVIFVKDLQGRYQFANPATIAAVGSTPEQVLGHTDAEFLGDALAARRHMENDRRVLDEGATLEVEEPVLQPDGTVRHWLVRKVPLRDGDGQLVGLLGVGRDITERKRADGEREATHLKLQMGIQAAGLVMADIDYRTNENHISAELARLLGLGNEATTVPRQAIFDRIHPDDRARYLEAIARTTDPAGDGHLAIDVRAMLPDGAVRWLHIRLQVTFSMVDGQLRPDRGICAARDVTAERLAEARMRAAQRFAESVIEGAGALVYAKDRTGRFILSNQAWRTLHGLSEEQARDITDVEVFGVEAARQLRANDERVLQCGEPVVVQESAMVRGQPMTFRSSKFPLYDEQGQAYAVCGVSTDITDVVLADQRKDEFIATLAHELRNPLAPIRNGLEILRRAGDLPPVAARTRDMMERQLVHMVRLVDDLLDVSRVSRGKLELRPQPTTLQKVIEHALEASQPALEAAGHVLALRVPVEPVPLVADLTRLAQVVSNLVNNATRYTQPGGRIEIDGGVEDGEAVIAVRDNGVGIEPAMLAHVFDLFVQGRGNPGGQAGLGIGLWLVRRLVELHHGRIEAASAGPGQGSTFFVRLPLQAPDSGPAANPAKSLL